MREWQEYKLEDIAELHNNKRVPLSSMQRSKKQGLFPYYGASGIVDYIDSYAFDGEYVLISEDGENLRTRNTPIAFKASGKFWVNNHAHIVKGKKDFHNDLIIYYLKNLDLNEFITGAAQPKLNKSALTSIPFLLPEDELEQEAIASVLSSLDDKIDLLHRQNQTLEAMAVTLFRQWFVEEAQENWEEVVITDLFEVRDGTHDSPKQASIGKPLITSKHILDDRLDIGNAYLISEDDFNQVNQRSKVDTGDILFSMIGTIGLIYLEQSSRIDYAIKNIGLFKTSQNPDWALYTYLWLRSLSGRQFIDEHKSGSTQEYVALGSLRSIVFQKPPIDVLQSFNKLASQYFSKLILNRSQMQTLEKLRDTLLPKLMSGEVRVAV